MQQCQNKPKNEDYDFMNSYKNLLVITLTLATLTAGAWAQTETASNAVAPAGNAVPAPAQPTITAADIQELRDALAAQQLQIQALQAELHNREQTPQQAPSSGPSVTRLSGGSSSASPPASCTAST